MGASLRAVCCSSVSAPFNASNCFGIDARDSGHSRVPEPPASTTA